MIDQLADAIPQHVWIADPSGRLEYVNRRLLEYVGVEEAQVMERSWTQFVHPDDFEHSLHAWAHCLSTGEPYEAELRLRTHEDCYRWHLVRALPARNETLRVTHWYGTNTDIDDHMRQRETLRQQAEIERHLLGIVSHDLRSPLHVISLGAMVLAEQHDPSPIIARIGSAARRAARMVGDLLDFTQARLGGGLPMELRPTALRDVVASVTQEFCTTHPQRAIHVVQQGDDFGMWDPERIAQLLVNLVANAHRYGSPSEPIVIAIRQEGELTLLEVTNQGNPIPAQQLTTLFMPMQRGTEAHAERSMGLGLYIVAEIAKRHGGSVAVSSAQSTGTTFSVRLPRSL